jgi:hypothetical protein
MDEKTNFSHMPTSMQERLRKWRKAIEADLKRIAGDDS